MAKAGQGEVDLLQGPVLGGMLRFALPIMVGTLLQQLYSMVDAVVLGQFVGKAALAAVGGSTIAIINLLLNFFVGLTSGAAIVVSQHHGAREPEQVSRAVHTSLLLAVGVGALLTVLGIATSEPLLTALDTPADTMAYSLDYMRWYYVGMIPCMIYNMGSSVLRAVGDSRRPLYFLVLCTVVNTVLDLLFVAVLKMEVAGAAIATSLSQLICAAFVLRSLSRRQDACRLELSKLRADRPLLWMMVRLGVPAGLQSMLYNVTNVYVQKAVNLMGTDTVAAWSICGKVDGVFWPISGAIGIAVMTFVGQNYGARNKARVHAGIRAGLALHAGMSLFFSLVVVSLRHFTAQLFSTDAEVLRQAELFVLCFSPFYILFSAVEVFSSVMRGVGNAVKPALITFFGVSVLRMVLLFAVTFPHPSIYTVSLCYPTTWVVTSLLFFLYYKFGHWMPQWEESRYD